MKKTLIVLAVLFTTPTLAQQAQPDPAFMQHAIGSLQAQRNAALDAQVLAEAKVAGLMEDLDKANLKIKGLESKLKPEDKPTEPEKK